MVNPSIPHISHCPYRCYDPMQSAQEMNQFHTFTQHRDNESGFYRVAAYNSFHNAEDTTCEIGHRYKTRMDAFSSRDARLQLGDPNSEYDAQILPTHKKDYIDSMSEPTEDEPNFQFQQNHDGADFQYAPDDVTDSDSTLMGDFDPNNFVPKRKKCCILGNELLFQIHLLSTIQSYRVPLTMFDRIMEVFFVHCIEGNLDFNRDYFYATRCALIKRLKLLYGMQKFRAKMVEVKMCDGSTTGVAVFDYMEVLMNMLDDPRIVNPQTVAKGYNIWNGKCQSSNEYGEIHTGEMWHLARDHYIGEDDSKFPMPLVAFYDKTHTDGKGVLALSPFVVTFAFLDLRTRRKTHTSYVLGIVPNLSYGKSSKAQRGKSKQSLIDEHNCLHAILEGLIQNKKNGGDIRIVFGKEKKCVVWIHVIIVDIDGNNRLCAA